MSPARCRSLASCYFLQHTPRMLSIMLAFPLPSWTVTAVVVRRRTPEYSSSSPQAFSPRYSRAPEFARHNFKRDGPKSLMSIQRTELCRRYSLILDGKCFLNVLYNRVSPLVFVRTVRCGGEGQVATRSWCWEEITPLQDGASPLGRSFEGCVLHFAMIHLPWIHQAARRNRA